MRMLHHLIPWRRIWQGQYLFSNVIRSTFCRRRTRQTRRINAVYGKRRWNITLISWTHSPLVKAKVEEIQKLNLPIDIIATSHGAIWRKSNANRRKIPLWMVSSCIKKTKSQLYTTRWDGTKKLAHKIAEEIAVILKHVLRFLTLAKPIKMTSWRKFLSLKPLL